MSRGIRTTIWVSRSPEVFPALRGGVFRVLDPPADHATDLDYLFGQGCESCIIDALRLVCESQMRSEHFEHDVRFVEQKRP